MALPLNLTFSLREKAFVSDLGSRVPAGSLLLRAPSDGLVAAAIYPPSVPPEGGKLNRAGGYLYSTLEVVCLVMKSQS
jgi:hypothetical protein